MSEIVEQLKNLPKESVFDILKCHDKRDNYSRDKIT